MFNGNCRAARRRISHPAYGFKSSGNSAFDAYKADTLRRLEDEQEAFEAFLQRLREAKDKSEFDAFMEDRAKTVRDLDDAEEDGEDNKTIEL